MHREFDLGNIRIRPLVFEKAGDVIRGHTHNFDHVTYICHGAVQIDILEPDGTVGQSYIKRASDGHNYQLIQAEKIHRLTALEDNSLGHCIYSHYNELGEVVKENVGYGPSYV